MAKVKKVRGRIDHRTSNTQLFGPANQIYKQGLDLESSFMWKLSFSVNHSATFLKLGDSPITLSTYSTAQVLVHIKQW